MPGITENHAVTTSQTMVSILEPQKNDTYSQASLRDLKTKLLHVHFACTKQPLNKVKLSYNTVYTSVLLISKYISKIYSNLSYVILSGSYYMCHTLSAL